MRCGIFGVSHYVCSFFWKHAAMLAQVLEHGIDGSGEVFAYEVDGHGNTRPAGACHDKCH